MFKFNFNVEDSQNEDSLLDKVTGNAEKCKVHEFNKNEEISSNCEIQTMKISGSVLKYVKSADALGQMKEKPEYLNENSDLVKNVYEGGLKIWECSQDLVTYLSQSSLKLQNLKILELGCGAALPSLYCLKQNPKSLDLQDFNPEVIDFITKPNFDLNMDKNCECEINLYSGDWADFLEKAKLKNVKYDLILTSETIYDENNYGKLIKIFQDLLSENGSVLLAAKIHYFGVGGSLRAFEKSLEQNGDWNYKTVFENCDSVNREIIQIQRN